MKVWAVWAGRGPLGKLARPDVTSGRKPTIVAVGIAQRRIIVLDRLLHISDSRRFADCVQETRDNLVLAEANETLCSHVNGLKKPVLRKEACGSQ